MANFTILMNSDKYLTPTTTCTIYQHESMVDSLFFIVPREYNGFDLGQFICTLIVKFPNGKVQTEILTADEELYKEVYYRYPYKAASTNITSQSGEIIVGLEFNHVDLDEKIQYTLTTSDCAITIHPRSEIYNFTEESLEKFDQMIGKLDARLQYMNMQTDKLLAGKVDDLGFDEEGKLHVKALDELLGVGVDVAVPGTEDTEDKNPDGVINADDIYSHVIL